MLFVSIQGTQFVDALSVGNAVLGHAELDLGSHYKNALGVSLAAI
jgi:hypothetical protein